MIGNVIRRVAGIGLLCGWSFCTPAAMASASDAGAPPVQVRDTEEGPVFTNMAGMTLYTYSEDEGTPGKSQCTSARYTMQDGRQFGEVPLPSAATRKSCADKQPPLLATADAMPTGTWSLIVRDGGAKQWAYAGAPLYTSIKDLKPGDVNGQGGAPNRNYWNAAKAPLDLPPGFKLIRREEGLVLATADGRPAYLRRGARVQRTSLSASQLLQPIQAPSFGKIAGKWAIVDSSGIKQYAFAGDPLFVLPEGYTDADAQKDGGWVTAVYQRATPIPSQIHARTTLLGRIFTTQDGMTLYNFSCAETEVPDNLACDDPGDAAAYWSALCGDAKECSRRWRPYLSAANARPSGEWTIQEVSDPPFLDPAGTTAPPGTPRVKAWAYRGKPVYTFVDDDEPGQTMGDWINYFSRSWFGAIPVPGPGLY